MICFVVLQECVDFVEGETGSCSETDFVEGETGSCSETDFVEGETGSGSETCVMFEEVTIKVEEAIDLKDDIPEGTSCPPIKTEHEVRFRGECEVVAAHAFRPFVTSMRKLHLTVSFFVLYYGCHMSFELWIAIVKSHGH